MQEDISNSAIFQEAILQLFNDPGNGNVLTESLTSEGTFKSEQSANVTSFKFFLTATLS